jgi:hypothetical protein
MLSNLGKGGFGVFIGFGLLGIFNCIIVLAFGIGTFLLWFTMFIESYLIEEFKDGSILLSYEECLNGGNIFTHAYGVLIPCDDFLRFLSSIIRDSIKNLFNYSAS